MRAKGWTKRSHRERLSEYWKRGGDRPRISENLVVQTTTKARKVLDSNDKSKFPTSKPDRITRQEHTLIDYRIIACHANHTTYLHNLHVLPGAPTVCDLCITMCFRDLGKVDCSPHLLCVEYSLGQAVISTHAKCRSLNIPDDCAPAPPHSRESDTLHRDSPLFQRPMQIFRPISSDFMHDSIAIVAMLARVNTTFSHSF